MYRYEGQAWSGRMATDWTEAVPSSPGTVGAVSLHLGRRWSQCDWSIVRGLRGRLHGRHNKTGTTSRCHAGPNDVRVSPCCDATRVMRRCLLLLALGDRGRGAESGRRGGRAGWPHREEGMRQRCSLEGPAEDVGRNNPLPGQGGTGAGRWFIPNGPKQMKRRFQLHAASALPVGWRAGATPLRADEGSVRKKPYCARVVEKRGSPGPKSPASWLSIPADPSIPGRRPGGTATDTCG